MHCRDTANGPSRSSGAPTLPKALQFYPADGSWNAPSPGSADVEDWPRILGEVHRKLHRMGNNRPHPHPDKTAGRILSWLNNFSVRLLGHEADRRCSAGLEHLDSPCGRVADALEHSTCGACQREDVLRGVIKAIDMAILTRGYVLVAVHCLDPPVAAVHRHDAFRCRPGPARDPINRLPFGSGDASPSDMISPALQASDEADCWP